MLGRVFWNLWSAQQGGALGKAPENTGQEAGSCGGGEPFIATTGRRNPSTPPPHPLATCLGFHSRQQLFRKTQCPPAWYPLPTKQPPCPTLPHPASHGPQALPWILIWHPEVHPAPPQCFPPSSFCSCPAPCSQEEQGSERSFSHKYTPISSDSFRPDQRFLPGAERVPDLWGGWPGWPPLPTKSQGH